MGHFLVGNVIIGLGDEVRPISLHDDLSLRIASEDYTSEKLKEDTSVERNVCCGGHYRRWDQEDCVHPYQHDQSPPWTIRRPTFESCDSEGE